MREENSDARKVFNLNSEIIGFGELFEREAVG